ncbi:uncharacterized protein F4822DRAFT_18879 [Hypoxylon trugodes]|uniref:uncharacterized protein n=1 Tax=Hypoxylon trugodes TaxID=326681 RepID=UPI0021932FED|nr:uncharacterized protein F4822DRAFT_18879 [Hypoxylon trugodes]KAI1393620.1 hypothetical protein F4822DRAFT_18879 [Hypoxylon trugodes]
MSIDIRDLSKDGVSQLMRFLYRRPEYGIARPSQRWHVRQEEKMEQLPSEILRTSNLLKRLVIRIVDKINPDMIDPRAVLCKTHTPLNPFLIRHIFLAVAYEVTVHTDLYHSWKNITEYPSLAAFLARVDSIAALWTEKEFFEECYGTPPFEHHHIFVQSRCEACILGAIGGNARALADLRAVITDRMERLEHIRKGRTPAKPRFSRFLEKWIDHLGDDRATKCRDMGANVLFALRATRPELLKWREQRKKDRKTNGPTVYRELKNTPLGSQLSRVPEEYRADRRSKHGIPVAVTNLDGAAEQRRGASNYVPPLSEVSVFRPDSMCAFSQVYARAAAYGDPDDPALGIDPYNDDEEEFEGYAEGEVDPEKILEYEEISRRKVADWYASQLKSRVDLSFDDTKSIMTGIHPAFQPAASQASFRRDPLKFKKDRYPAPPKSMADSVWTDATVYTIDPSSSTTDFRPDLGRDGIPAVPRVPPMYRESSARHSRRHSINANDERPSSHRPSASRTNTEIPHPRPKSMAPSTSLPTRPPIVHPPKLQVPTPNSKPNPRNFMFADSDAGSTAALSMHEKRWIRDRKGMKDVPRTENPFVTRVRERERESGSSGTRTSGSRGSRSSKSSRSTEITLPDEELTPDDSFSSAGGYGGARGDWRR